jgi:hypothetical protein
MTQPTSEEIRSYLRGDTEPECCGVGMIKMSGYDVWHCADAFFTLFDDDVLVPYSVPLQLEPDATDFHRDRFQHLQATTIDPEGVLP